MRTIPLVTEEDKIRAAEKLAGDKPPLALLPYQPLEAGLATVGSEVASGRIKDDFTPVISAKPADYNIKITKHKICDNNIDNIVCAIAELRKSDCKLLLCSCGMSVDRDDNTPGAIKKSGTEIIFYGAPTLSGAMFLMGYFNGRNADLRLAGMCNVCQSYSFRFGSDANSRGNAPK